MLTLSRAELRTGIKVAKMREEDFDQGITGEIYRFIVKYKTDHNGNSPSYRQIAEAMRLPTINCIKGYLRELSRAGLIRQESGSRGLIVVGSEWIGPKAKTG